MTEPKYKIVGLSAPTDEEIASARQWLAENEHLTNAEGAKAERK